MLVNCPAATAIMARATQLMEVCMPTAALPMAK
jgi:hypothetical protein